MATTSPDNLRTPNPTDPYNLVADLAILASDTQAALVKRGNFYMGTSAQRIAFTTAPAGTHWQDTNGDRSEWVRDSGAWIGVTPLHGTVDFNFPSGGGTGLTQSVSFPSGYFKNAPLVQLTAYSATGASANVSINVSSVSTTTLVIRGDRGATASNFTVAWSAFPRP